MQILQKYYASYCMFFHEIAAQYDHFPNILLDDLPKVLHHISWMGQQRAEAVGAAVIRKVLKLKKAQ